MINRQQELEELKSINPEIFLRYFGIEFKWEKNIIRHYAVWRDESQPSVDWTKKNESWIFIDRGDNTKKGSIIDFYMFLTCKDYVESIRELRDIFLLKKNIKIKPQFASYKPKKDKRNGITYQIKKINNTIQNKALWEYLKSRAINIIPDWLFEIYWTQNNKNYFGLGIQDQNGNYICRNKYMKCNLGQDITYSLLKNLNDNEKEKIIVITEGIFDALTAYQIWNKKIDIISLNSVNNIQNLIADDILKNYKEIILALDNDNAGIKAKNEILLILNKEIRVEIYPIQEDLNSDFVNKVKGVLND